MRSPDIRHVILLRLTLTGSNPEIRRVVTVDRDITLADLRQVVNNVFDGPSCAHHLFTDSVDGSGWSQHRRRWGDKWTMIDFRDPTVIDESTARIGTVLRDRLGIYLAHTCDANWVVEIAPGPYDVVPASDPHVRLVSGDFRAPFACSRNPYEHDVLVKVLDDRAHPDHEALRACIERTVGPWATFEADVFDVHAAQQRLDADSAGTASSGSLLPALTRVLPMTARQGLRTHVAEAGLNLPVVVTIDEAAHITEGFRWLIRYANDAGILLIDGAIDEASVLAGAGSLGCDPEQVRKVIAAARALRLVYSRNGRLVVKKRVGAADTPGRLWTMLAETVSSSFAGYAQELLLLAIADGTLGDPGIGLAFAAEAFAIADGGRWDSFHSRWTEIGDDACGQRCDCPRVDGSTWHDIVAKAIRDAARSGSIDGAVLVASRENWQEAGMPHEWFDDEAGWGGIVATRQQLRGGGRVHSPDTTSALLQEVAGLIDVLTLFGLGRTDDGEWIVPAVLREFAKAILQPHHRAYH